MKRINLLLALLISATVFVSCDKESSDNQFGIFKVLEDGQTIEMDGVIGSSVLDDFNELEAAFPDVNTINIVSCDGSTDDAVNLLVSAKVHQKGMSTHILANGDIASGGVDFFMAGTQRTKENNTRIGVHSWANGNGDVATDFPVGDPEHQAYIDYYISIGYTQQESEDFYFFTINAATHEDIHWMTEAEIEQYGLLTE